MARGSNQITVSSELRGSFMEGFIKTSQTFYPGMLVQKDPSVALRQGRHTYKLADMAATGDPTPGPLYVVLNDYLRQGLVTDSFAAGERCFLYLPKAGDELNLLVKNLTGTADDHPLAEGLMVDDGTGKLVVTDAAQKTVAQLLEAITDPTADTLAWCEWRGN